MAYKVILFVNLMETRNVVIKLTDKISYPEVDRGTRSSGRIEFPFHESTNTFPNFIVLFQFINILK